MVRPLKAAMVLFDEAGFVQRIGVQCDLHIHGIGDGQAAVDGGRCRAPVLVELQTAGAGAHHFLQRLGLTRIALAEKADVHRQ